MNDKANVVPESAAAEDGIPLDLTPLLTPYGQYRRLSIRIAQLPAMATFSKGVKNDDGTWSLMPGDLDGLELLLPEDVEPPKTLAVRIVGIDRDENATIVGQLDVPLPPRKTAPRPTVDAGPALAEAEARWQVESEKRLSEQETQLQEAWQEKVLAERSAREDAQAKAAEAVQQLTELSGKLEAALARAAAAETTAADHDSDMRQRADEAEARLAQEAAARIAAAKTQWEEESDSRIAAAVEQAVQNAEASAEARLEEARAQWREEADREIEVARRQCTEAESSMRHLEAQLAEAEAHWRAEGETRLSEQAARLREEWQQKVQAERSAREGAEKRAEAAAQKLAGLSAQLEAAMARAVAAESATAGRDSDTPRSAEAAAAEAVQEWQQRMAAAKTQWEEESEARIAAAVQEAVRKSEAAAEARLGEARKDWGSEAETALETAAAKWRAEEAKRFAEARAEWQKHAQANATRGRRKLRGVAKKQGLVRAGRHILRLAVIAGCVAAGYVLYTKFGPTMIAQWKPKIVALVSDVRSTALAELQSLSEGAKPRMAVATSVANLRAGPSTATALVSTLPRDTTVTVLERRGDWLQVEVDGDRAKQGWLHRSLLRPGTER